MSKQKWPLADALRVAAEVEGWLAPGCERIVVAGSVRRKKPEVGDVEIVFVPRLVEMPGDDFFTPPGKCSAVEEIASRLLDCGLLALRKNVNGAASWGDKNKLAVHVASGMPVDLFACAPESWWNYLVCRTGGAENNKEIALAALRKGWKWRPYEAGFSRPGPADSGIVTMASERAVFEFVGLPWREPEDRR